MMRVAVVRVLRLFCGLVFLGALGLARGLSFRRGQSERVRGVVLYYHGIKAEERERFGRQLDWLRRWARPVSPLTGGGLDPGIHHAAVTFDDGFQSVIDHALPELVQRNIPAAVFLPCAFLGRPPGWEMDSHCPDRGEWVAPAERWRAVRSGLLAVGSHTLTHPNLLEVDRRQAWEEISGSRQRLQQLLGERIELFSFPYGAHDGRLLEMARRAGYRRVFTIEPRLTSFAESEFVVGRVRVSPRDWFLEFYVKVRGGYSWLSRASAFKRFLGGRLEAGVSAAGQAVRWVWRTLPCKAWRVQ